ncbi:MAG: aspartyl protease family protein [Rhizomicrobium sp.]
MLSLESFSRRRFVGFGATSLLVAPVMAKAQSIVPTTAQVQKVAAATDIANLLTIGVTIGGKGPFHFVVDTGADRTIIAEDLAAALELTRGAMVKVEGAVRSLPAQTVTLGDISFGAVRKEQLVVPVLPRALLDADGYLGLDVIDGYQVTLDFRKRALLIQEPRNRLVIDHYKDNETTIPVVGEYGHLRTNHSLVDGIITTTFIDTGAEVSVGNSNLFEALTAQSASYAGQETVTLSGVTGGTLQGRVADINRIKMNSLTFYDSKIVICDLQIFDLWGLRARPALLIGMDFLRHFNQVSVDYGRKELHFDLASLITRDRG